jgi:hypothetical protein
MIGCLGPLRRLSDTKAPFAVDSVRWIVGRFGSLRQTPRLSAALGPLGHLAQEGNGFRKENPQANSQFAWIRLRGQGLGLKGSPLRRTSISLSPGPVRCYPQAWQPPNCHKLTVHSTISLGYRMEAGSQNRILAMMQARLTPNQQSVTQPHVTKITDLVLKID